MDINFMPGPSLTLPGVWTVDTLPPAADNLDMYAIVSDLFGEKRDVVRASSVGSFCFWQPVRPTYAKSYNIAGGNMSVTALGTASIMSFTGVVPAGVARNINFDLTNAYPGWAPEVAFDGSLGLGASFNLFGSGIGSVLGLLLNARRRYFTELSGGVLTLKPL